MDKWSKVRWGRVVGEHVLWLSKLGKPFLSTD